jgi:uracil-DNA glycosylase
MDRSGGGPDRGTAATNVSAINRLLEDLAGARIGRTFNQFRELGPDDVADAPALRRANLRHYLLERREASIVAVGEAAGYQGMRWSGIAFTSERDLLRWGDPFRTTCKTRVWSEPSGTIVHGLLERLGAERRVILWNLVPTHPHQPGKVLSNRRPTAAEIAAGRALAERFLDLVRPRVLIAVGRIAFASLGGRPRYVRHPANAGATRFRSEMTAVLAAEL